MTDPDRPRLHQPCLQRIRIGIADSYPWRWYEPPHESIDHRLDGPDLVYGTIPTIWWTIKGTIIYDHT